jgi:starch phosphorylase
MRKSMARLTPRFSADRTVREYTEQHYLPGAESFHWRAAGKGVVGRQIVDSQQAMEKDWPALRFGAMKVEAGGERHAFELQVYLYDLDPNAVRVEIYADGIDGDGPVRQEMERIGQLAGTPGEYLYRAQAPATRPPADFTARVTPHYAGVAVPLEDERILWQR